MKTHAAPTREWGLPSEGSAPSGASSLQPVDKIPAASGGEAHSASMREAMAGSTTRQRGRPVLQSETVQPPAPDRWSVQLSRTRSCDTVPQSCPPRQSQSKLKERAPQPALCITSRALVFVASGEHESGSGSSMH